MIKLIADWVLFASCLLILAGCFYLTLRTRFVQMRFIPSFFALMKKSIRDRSSCSGHTILPHKALFTAMSTTLGISTIVAPVLAIRLGGPGAMLGFLITSFLGSAATYVEVNLSIRYREVKTSGVMGGPMPYIKKIFGNRMAGWYAACCLVLMMAWSGAQANQLAAVFNSPMLGKWGVPTMLSGVIIAILVLLILIGGIKRVGSFSSKLVPVMFVLYVGSCLWIIGMNWEQLGAIFSTMVRSAFEPYAMATGTLVGGFVSALRWGVFKGLQTNEAGIGTQSIPHSMAETSNPTEQGALAMLSTYMAGFIAFLSGCVALITNTWQDESLPIGISMVAASFKLYFSYFGVVIITLCTFLFGFGTILGNCFNGSQAFRYLTQNRWIRLYFAATVVMIFLGAISEVTFIWSIVDLILACMAVPHILALVVWAYKYPEAILAREEKAEVTLES